MISRGGGSRSDTKPESFRRSPFERLAGGRVGDLPEPLALGASSHESSRLEAAHMSAAAGCR